MAINLERIPPSFLKNTVHVSDLILVGEGGGVGVVGSCFQVSCHSGMLLFVRTKKYCFHTVI